MRSLDWRRVLTEHSIEYVERGPNVKRGEINIRCPFCGSADPSHHMGLNLETGFWACWRNREHRGKSPLRLLVQLLGISYFKARQLAGLTDDYVDPDGYSAVVARLMQAQQVEKVEHVERRFLQLPHEFVPLHKAPPFFARYLRDDRLFGTRGTQVLQERMGVCAATRGDFRGRVIFPFYADGELVTWTARAIGQATLRYRDLEVDESIIPVKETLYNLDCRIDGGKALALVEGPIDAAKIDVFGMPYGVRAVALATNSMSEQQLYLLEECATVFDRVLVMMDMASTLGIVDSMRMRQELRSIRNAVITQVPYGLKDTALMSPRQATRWAAELAESL